MLSPTLHKTLKVDECETVSNSSATNAALKKCNNMKPVYVRQQKSKFKLSELKMQLESCTNSSNSNKRSTRLDDRKKIEDCYRELQTDFVNIHKKLDIFNQCILGIFERMDELESRVEKLEKNLVDSVTDPPSYSKVVKSSDGERIDKLEFLNSEENRKKRLLHATITHPKMSEKDN